MSFRVSFCSCVFCPFSIAITSIGEERANLSAFRTFVRFVLVWICRFPLGVWEGLRFVIVALPGLFSYLFVWLCWPFWGGGRCVGLALCCFVVCSARRFVLCLSVCHFVLCFSVLFSITITSLGEERANISAFRTFIRFVLVWICRFPLPLWSGKGCGL